ncbi:hypothetical protein K7432_014180 [Basidiobolus ranarum]|uniref:BHLH domain-containing protein n=1 Tax=Basidiobolus ranarum TaxID=34480 RepID=A0ABR2WHZ9_9FUNG
MGDRFEHSFTSDLMPIDSCQFQSWLTRGAPGNNKSADTMASKYHSPPSHPIGHHYTNQNPELLPVISSNSFHENTVPEYTYGMNSVSPNRSHSLTPSHYLMDSTEMHQHNSSFSSMSSESQEHHRQPHLRPQSNHNLSINPHAKPDTSINTSIPSPVPTPTTASPHSVLHHGHDLHTVSPNLNPALVSNIQPLAQQTTGMLSNQTSFTMTESEDGSNSRRTSISLQASPRRKSSDLRPILPDGPTANSETDPETSTTSLQKQNPWYLRRIYHRTAEQQRRDAFKDCLNELKDIIPGASQKRANKLVLLRQVVEHVKSLQGELYEKDQEIERLRIMLQECSRT